MNLNGDMFLFVRVMLDSIKSVKLTMNHSFRLFAHSEDPDIDEPYKPPVGHVLGDSECVKLTTFVGLSFNDDCKLLLVIPASRVPTSENCHSCVPNEN